MGDAVLWGLVAASSLAIGGLLGVARTWPPRWIGLVLAFGAGALISAVSFDLAEEGGQLGGFDVLAGGLAAGALTYYLLDRVVDRPTKRRGGTRDDGDGDGGQAGGDAAGGDQAGGGGGGALALGSLLDGIPEQMVLGIGLAAGDGVSLSLLIAIFVSNLPEAIGGSADLRKASRSPGEIRQLWFGVAAICAISTIVGYAIADTASRDVQGAIDGFAAGSLLVMLIDSMVPEASRQGGRAAGLVTVLGFAVAAALTGVG
ncbi:MAG: ZIP family metal transporter [Solirubrobacteraceae bacterium]|nr:ZIP family metal transporter [Solirubrobacteraceae bacterium]